MMMTWQNLGKDEKIGENSYAVYVFDIYSYMEWLENKKQLSKFQLDLHVHYITSSWELFRVTRMGKQISFTLPSFTSKYSVKKGPVKRRKKSLFCVDDFSFARGNWSRYFLVTLKRSFAHVIKQREIATRKWFIDGLPGEEELGDFVNWKKGDRAKNNLNAARTVNVISKYFKRFCWKVDLS